MKQKTENSSDSLISRDCVRNLLDNIQGSYTYFKPTQRFYDSCGINCRRWAKLVRGDLSITIDELKRLCKTLNVEFTAETFARQLKIFE
jgi:hypothetical protein